MKTREIVPSVESPSWKAPGGRRGGFKTKVKMGFMMCDCIQKIENETSKMETILKEREGLTLQEVKVKEVGFDSQFRTRTHSTLEIHVKERKRPIVKKMVHNYCPFCGEKYEED